MSGRYAHRADAVPGLARGLVGGLDLGSRLGHDADGRALGSLWLAHETRQRYGRHSSQHEETHSVAWGLL